MQSRHRGEAAQLSLHPLPRKDSDGSITVGLLGPLLLVHEDQVLTPSAPKLRQVLSLLAVQANSLTAVDQLVEELWGENPPHSAPTAVQSYIYQLRKLLKLDDKPADGAHGLLSRPGGYVLRLPDIDTHQFEALYRRGHQELLANRTEAAAETFRTALSLWRGGFAEDVETGPLLRSHAHRLEDLYGTVLQRLHQLMHEASAPRTVRTGHPAPAQLPAEISDFVGRSAELDLFTRHLVGPDSQGLRVINVVGRPGIGKTTFVARAARDLRAHFPDGQLYVDLAGGQTSTRRLLVGMLKALGADETNVPHSVAEAALMFRSWTIDRRLLVVLDNASAAHALQHLFPSGSGCALVVISRAPVDALSGAVRQKLPALSLAESVQLLANTAGERRVSQELDAVEQLAELSDRLPLALRAIGAKLAGRPNWHVSRMVVRMTDERNRLNELSYGGFDVFSRLAEAYRTLSTRQRWVLAAADGEPLTTVELAQRLGMSPVAVQKVLDELIDADLVEEIGGGAEPEPRHRVPSLVRLSGMVDNP